MAAVANENDLAYIEGTPGCAYNNEVAFDGQRYPADRLAEVLIADTAEPLAAFTRDFFAGSPAVTKAAYGSSTAYYVAFQLELRFIREFSMQALAQADVHGITAIRGEDAIRVTCLEGDGEKYYFVLNGLDKPQRFTIQDGCGPMTDVLTGCALEGVVELPPLGVKILKAD